MGVAGSVPEAWIPDGREELAERLATPAPDKNTACGLPPPSLLTNSDVLSLAARDGLNVTLTVQLLPAPSVAPHVLAFEKSAAWAPRNAICHTLMGRLQTLVRVMVCGKLLVPTTWSGNISILGDKSAAIPTPVRIMQCGLPGALSLMLTVDFRAPLADGENLTSISQLPPGAIGLVQLLIWTKS